MGYGQYSDNQAPRTSKREMLTRLTPAQLDALVTSHKPRPNTLEWLDNKGNVHVLFHDTEILFFRIEKHRSPELGKSPCFLEACEEVVLYIDDYNTVTTRARMSYYGLTVGSFNNTPYLSISEKYRVREAYEIYGHTAYNPKKGIVYYIDEPPASALKDMPQ